MEENGRMDEHGATVAPSVHEESKDDWHNEAAERVAGQTQTVGQAQVLALKLSATDR